MSEKSKRPLTSRDFQRPKTSPGIPVAIDHELTPPPQEQPQPSSLKGYDTISAPIRDQLDMLANGLGNVTTAIGQVWDARKDGQQLERLNGKLDALAGYATEHQTMLHEFVMPAIKECMASTHAVALQLPRVLAQLEGITFIVGNLDRQVRAIELEMRTSTERSQSDHRVLQARVAAGELARTDHEIRIELLERENRDREVATKTLATKERRKSAGLGGGVAVVAVAIVETVKRFL